MHARVALSDSGCEPFEREAGERVGGLWIGPELSVDREHGDAMDGGPDVLG